MLREVWVDIFASDLAVVERCGGVEEETRENGGTRWTRPAQTTV
jgi:hypothetical protein